MIPTVSETLRPAPSRVQNRCLAALSSNAFELIRPHLKETVLTSGDLLWESDRRHTQTFFPASGLVSITLPMQDGAAIEVGSVGSEGAAGLASITEISTRATVLIGGHFAQIDSTKLAQLAQQDAELGEMLRHCRDWLYAQAQRLAACNAVHAADKRLCRWLVACQERMRDGRIYATQETIGALLGMRRTTVTLIAQTLHSGGLIDYARGKIVVRDPARLAEGACECCAHFGPARWPSTRLEAARKSQF